LSRLNSKEDGVIILVMQRLHQDDLVGHVMGQDDWEVVSFPANRRGGQCSYRPKHIWAKRLERKGWGCLEPQRESRPALDAIRRTIGEYNFASQYQQDPMPLGGAIVKTEWLKYYAPCELPSSFGCVLQSWDTANKSGELNDFSVCTTWGATLDQYYLLDVYRKRLNYPDLRRAVREQCRQFHADVVLIEDKASGTQLIQTSGPTGCSLSKPYVPLPGSDKTLRLYAQTAEFESGRVLLPEPFHGFSEYVRELTTFPGGKYDDQVDSTTQALSHLKNKQVDPHLGKAVIRSSQIQ